MGDRLGNPGAVSFLSRILLVVRGLDEELCIMINDVQTVIIKLRS